jgi:hypothetical protein
MDEEKEMGSVWEGSPWSFDPKEYRDLDSMMETGGRLGRHVAQRLDDLLGVIEWLKTDCAKKGSWKHAKEMEVLSSRVERTSRIMEGLSRLQGSGPAAGGVNAEMSRRCLDHDRELYGVLLEIEAWVRKMTEAGVVPTEQNMEEVRRALNRAEKMANDRERLLKLL